MSTDQAQPYPCVVAAIPADGMYLVALDPTWGRILNTQEQQYWPTGLIGTHLVMTGPWEDYTGPQDVLAEWIAQAQDMEIDLTPEQRERIARRRRLHVVGFCTDVARAAQAQRVKGSRSARPEAREDQRAMWEQIAQRIQQVAREAQTMADVPRWLLAMAAQLGIEP